MSVEGVSIAFKSRFLGGGGALAGQMCTAFFFYFFFFFRGWGGGGAYLPVKYVPMLEQRAIKLAQNSNSRGPMVL